MKPTAKPQARATLPLVRCAIYTLRGQERDIVKHLEVEGQEGGEAVLVLAGHLGDDFLDGGLEVGEVGVIAAVQGLPLDEPPQPLDQVPVRRIPRQEQQLYRK